MEFEKMEEREYRSLGLDALKARQAQILAVAEDAESDVDPELLDGESRRCQAEIERRNKVAALRGARIEEVRAGAGTVTASSPKPERAGEEDIFDTPQYRRAFMRAVQTGSRMPEEFRAPQYRENVAINGTYEASTDTPIQIPTTMQRQVIKKMEERGGIWAAVRKVSIQGGIWFRVRDMKINASWVGEKEVSEPQKVGDDTQLNFTYNQLECRIQRTLLFAAVTYEDFQADFVSAVADAMVDALEAAIIRGTGTGQPLGIVNDKRITSVVEMTQAEVEDWVQWHKKVKAAMPRLYRNASFIFGQGTWDSYIETLRDKNDHPVSQTGYNPVTGEEQYRLMGKQVHTVDTAVLPDFDTAAAGDVFAIFGNLSDYLVNTQPGMPLSVKTWDDDDHNLRKTRALMAVDGKVLDPYGFILIKKKASA